jgi:hypothetical protein
MGMNVYLYKYLFVFGIQQNAGEPKNQRELFPNVKFRLHASFIRYFGLAYM